MISCHLEPFSAFIKDLQMYGCDVHLYRGANTYGLCAPTGFGTETPPWWDTENVYFLAGVRQGMTKRASDSDVLWRSMFTFDFDIKKELEKNKNLMPEISTIPAAIQTMADMIIEKLETHPTWKNFRYIVMSGNGMHVHYFGGPVQVNKEQWAAGMRDVFDEINQLTPIPCDTGCGNAGRIMRMPGSWNVKDPSNKKPVTIEIWMPDASVPDLRFIQERGALAIARRNERREAEQKAFEEKHPEGGSTVIDLINNIPIEQVVCRLFAGLTVRMVKKDGGIRFADEKDVERGFFKHKEYNIIVHEGTGLFPAPEGKGYNCLGLAKTVLGKTTRETIEWFGERSTPVRDADKADREQWSKENEVHEIAFIDEQTSTPSSPNL